MQSNEWTGKYSFQGKSLHAVTPSGNPYEEVTGIIGRTLSAFDDDQQFPIFGFGDGKPHIPPPPSISLSFLPFVCLASGMRGNAS